jgi:hypothetical protein
MMKFIFNNSRNLFALSLIIPIFFNLAIYLYSSNIFSLLISINITYYLIIIALLFYVKKYRQEKRPRSPFIFLNTFHTTHNKKYWDEFQQPLRHLIGAEIGVYRGNNTEKIINYLNMKKMYLVDPWKVYINEIEKDISEVDDNQKIQDERYEFVKKRFQKNTKVEIIRKSSVDASKQFPDNYFDFIYRWRSFV